MTHASHIGADPAATSTCIETSVMSVPGMISLSRERHGRKLTVAINHVVIGLEVMVIVGEISMLV